MISKRIRHKYQTLCHTNDIFVDTYDCDGNELWYCKHDDLFKFSLSNYKNSEKTVAIAMAIHRIDKRVYGWAIPSNYHAIMRVLKQLGR